MKTVTDFQKWEQRYKDGYCTKENIIDLVHLKVLTTQEYETIIGEPLTYTTEEIKAQKIAFLDKYKHEKRMYFPYGNCEGVQRFDESTDLPFMQITLEGLNRGIANSIDWKYSNGRYDHVEMPHAKTYIENMILIGGMLISVAFTVEKAVVEHIESLSTVEELSAFNEKEMFDTVFEQEMQKVIDSITKQVE